MIVRDAVPADAAAIGEVHAAAWLAGYAEILDPADLARLVETRRTTRWPATFASPTFVGTTLLVAERDQDGELVGFVHAGAGEIYSLNVHPAEWGRGAATALVDAAIGRLAADGATSVRLWTWEAAARARGFYAKTGFTPTGRSHVEGPEGGPPLVEIEYARPCDAAATVAGCMACDLSAGRLPLPGGLIHRTQHWVVEHCVGPLGLGTLVVKPQRHVVQVADLNDEEADELGPLLCRASAVARDLIGAEQVYNCLWSHAGAEPGHIHYVVQPVTQAQMTEHDAYGPRLQLAMLTRGDLPDSAEVDRLAELARAAFTRPQ